MCFGRWHTRAAHAMVHLIALSYRVPFMSRHQQFNGKWYLSAKAWRIGRRERKHMGVDGRVQTLFFLREKGVYETLHFCELAKVCFLLNSKFYV